MKKKRLYIISSVITIMILVSCDSPPISTTIQISESTDTATSVSQPPDQPGLSPIPTTVQEILTVDEAFEIYNTWLERHADISTYTLNRQSYEQFELSGEKYYLFHADEMSMYWYNILVHIETGELLFMMTSDGEYPVTSIERLDDWYNNNYAPYSPALASTPDNAEYTPNPCFFGDFRNDDFFNTHAVLIVDGQFIEDEYPIVDNGIVSIPQRFLDSSAEVNVCEGMESVIPNIIAVTLKENNSGREVKISEETAVEKVKIAFSEVEWGEFSEEIYGDVFELLLFTSNGIFGNFQVIDVKLSMHEDEFAYVSVWVDIYTGDMFSKDCGYEGVYSISDGIGRAVTAIKYQLL